MSRDTTASVIIRRPADEVFDLGVFTAEPGKPGFGPKNVLDFRRIHLRRGVQTVTVTVANRPSWAGIDPYNKTIDRNSDDNAVAVAAARPEGPR